MTGMVHNTIESCAYVAKSALVGSRRKSADLPRPETWPLVLLTCLFPMFLLAGCSVLRQTHNTVRTEHVYSKSNRRIEKQMEEWADQAFLSHCGPDLMLLDDKHYKKGFRAGFSRYLRTGSTNEPLLPPPEYLKAKYVSWEGRDAVNRWIRGHEVGATIAAQSGYRELIKIPVLGAIAPDDNNMPPAESIVVDSILGGPMPTYAPLDPQPLPPSPPAEDELAPLPEQAVPYDSQPVSAPADDRDFDAFSLPIRSSDEAPSQFPGTPTTQADPANARSNDIDTSRTSAARSSESQRDALQGWGEFNQNAHDRVPAHRVPPQNDEARLWADGLAELGEHTDSAMEEELDFRWLESLPDEPAPQDESDAAWERTRAAVPESREQDGNRRTPSSDDLWLHPPEAPADHQNDFGFPDSSTINVVFEEPAEATPTAPAAVNTQPASQDQSPVTSTDKAALRRAALYAQIASAAKPQPDHVDQCVQPAFEQEVRSDREIIDHTAWPDLDKIMSWPAEQE